MSTSDFFLNFCLDFVNFSVYMYLVCDVEINNLKTGNKFLLNTNELLARTMSNGSSKTEN